MTNKIDSAYKFYCKHIYDEEKILLLQENNLKVAGFVPSVMWELFGAILTGRSGVGNVGADLNGWEVKSAKENSSFEYQYHLNTGAKKLHEDCLVNHLFLTYSEMYKNVIARAIKGENLANQFFMKWEPQYFSNYDSSIPSNARRQRFRKNIPFNYVETNGHIILIIKDSIMIERYDDTLDSFL
mgnify:CR=1 FL=1